MAVSDPGFQVSQPVYLLTRVLQLWVPVGATPFRRKVQHQPQRIDIRRAARILTRVGHRGAYLAAIEVVNLSALPVEDAEAGDIRVLRTHVRARIAA